MKATQKQLPTNRYLSKYKCLFEELKVAAFIKKFIAICGVQSFTVIFKPACHCSAYDPEDAVHNSHNPSY
jgi:hypothetical protein